MSESPVAFDVERPPAFDRAHVVLRIGVLIVFGWIGHPLGLLWLGLPAVAAFLVSRKGGERYVGEDGPTVAAALNWVLDLVAYVALLTDRLPGGEKHPVRFEVEPTASPTVRSALLRILYAIPSVIVLSILTFVGAVVWAIAMVLVLVDGRYPPGMWRFLFGIVQWEARLVAYLASLVDEYPPFRLDTRLTESPVHTL